MMHLVWASAGQEEAAGALLDACTQRLLAKGVQQWTLPWSRQALRREIEDSTLLLGMEDGALRALACIKQQAICFPELSLETRGYYLSHLATDPALWHQGVGRAFLSRILQRFSPLYLDCWAGSEKLKAFYSSLGMRCLGDIPEEDYFISVFQSKGE